MRGRFRAHVLWNSNCSYGRDKPTINNLHVNLLCRVSIEHRTKVCFDLPEARGRATRIVYLEIQKCRLHLLVFRCKNRRRFASAEPLVRKFIAWFVRYCLFLIKLPFDKSHSYKRCMRSQSWIPVLGEFWREIWKITQDLSLSISVV